MAAIALIRIPKQARRDAKLTVARSGDLYGCQLTMFVKLVGGGDPKAVPDSNGNLATDFLRSPDVRTVPGSLLREADDVYLDVVVAISQPADLVGEIAFTATLEHEGVPSSTLDAKVALKPGDKAALADLSWDIGI